jgi:hypothetical protein
MEDWIEVIKLTLPSFLMLIAVYYVVGGFLRSNVNRQKLKAIRGNHKLITPVRLQAYERLVLLLERISPEALVMRADYPAKTGEQLHALLLQDIRAEFDHNLSQQLYVSADAWNSVKNAKNYTVTLINNAAKSLDNDAPAIALSRRILDMAMELEIPIAEKAINELKREIQQIF